MNSLQFHQLYLMSICVCIKKSEAKPAFDRCPSLFVKTLNKKNQQDCSDIHALLLHTFIKRLLTCFSLYLSYEVIAGWNG